VPFPATPARAEPESVPAAAAAPIAPPAAQVPIAPAAAPIQTPTPTPTTAPTSAAATTAAAWAADAERELQKIPFFVRGKARRNTERFALERGVALITVETLYDAKAHFSR
jgi:light-independent protochlorophyllide reductase subunit B